MLIDSVPSVSIAQSEILYAIEWFFTILFTLEYFVRIYTSPKPRAYIFSFFGVIDLLAILPTYLSFLFIGVESLLVIRAIRLLRVFRVLKLMRLSQESVLLLTALRRSMAKITVFVGGVITIVVIAGATMYLIEGEQNGFTSIPKSMYWAIVTVTTVGYGDLTPQTDIGRLFASLLMIMGYGIVAVPMGIISAEIAQTGRDSVSTRVCSSCSLEGHSLDAKFCKKCSAKL